MLVVPMGRNVFVSAFILTLLVTTFSFSLKLVGVAEANFLQYPSEPEPFIVSVETPINASTYPSDVSLIFNVSLPLFLASTPSIIYNLDGQPTSVGYEIFREGKSYSAMLEGLSDGWHTLTVTVTGESAYDEDPGSSMKGNKKTLSDSVLVTFRVDTQAPSISLLSPRSENRASADVALNFILSKPVEHISYSLDGKDNVTINGNTTLNGLTSGVHSITVYACDATGNMGASETVTFTVNSDSEPFLQTNLFSVIIGVVALGLSVGAVGIFYGKKHKTKTCLE